VLKSAAALVLLVAVLVPAGAAPAISVAETCRGLPATIVGPGDEFWRLQGTPGDDVIVTNGAAQVSAGAGNDTICTTNTPGPNNHSLNVQVDAGPGTDVVDRTGENDPNAGGHAFAVETFVGNDTNDVVIPGDSPFTIDSAGGDDSVGFVGFDGRAGSITLGTGNDTITSTQDNLPMPFRAAGSRTAGELDIDAGPGRDVLRFEAEEPGLWTIDAARGEVRHAGRVYLGFGDVEDYDVGSGAVANERIDVIGSARAETLHVGDAGLLHVVDMRGGGDRVTLRPAEDRERHPTIKGGRGRDAVTLVARRGFVTVDLERGTFGVGNTTTGRIAGFEDAGGSADFVVLVGDGGRNRLRPGACRRATVLAGASGDVVRAVAADLTACVGAGKLSATGGLGNDRMVGGPRADRLDGGPGCDVADGNGGRDVCPDAEVRRSC
jgi:RTX calcium-binding nonapeptide repeat (4 copies)